jgi:hypothetical protein
VNSSLWTWENPTGLGWNLGDHMLSDWRAWYYSVGELFPRATWQNLYHHFVPIGHILRMLMFILWDFSQHTYWIPFTSFNCCFSCCCSQMGSNWPISWFPRLIPSLPILQFTSFNCCFSCCCSWVGSNWPISWFPRLILSFTVLQFTSIVIDLAAVDGCKKPTHFMISWINSFLHYASIHFLQLLFLLLLQLDG